MSEVEIVMPDGGLKLKEMDTSSLASAQSLFSLDITHAGVHSRNLAAVSAYSPSHNRDEDEAALT